MMPYGYGGYPYAGYRVYGPVVTPMYPQPNVMPVAPYGYVVNPANGAVRPAVSNAPAAVQGTPNTAAPARAVTPAATNASASAPGPAAPATQLTSTGQR